MKKIYIFIGSLIACIFMYYIEQIMALDYEIKTILKILTFFIIPLIYIKLIKKSTFKGVINYKNLDKKHFRLGILFGLAAFFIVIIAYYLLSSFIDLKGISSDLQSRAITPSNFIFVGLYITFGNSFLEEFFFRGFIFLSLYELGLRKTAYIYSSILFALYHIGIFKTWFNIWLTGLALIGLIIIGLIFNWLDTKSNNFINSWIVHILADSAIILVGLKMFNII